MIWNAEEGYTRYKVSLDNLKTRLKIGAVDYEVRPELAPYITEILEYLDKRLIALGDDADIIEKLNEIFDIFSYGADLIVGLESNVLAEEVGMDISENNASFVKVDEENYYYEISKEQVISYLKARMNKYQYSGRLVIKMKDAARGKMGVIVRFETDEVVDIDDYPEPNWENYVLVEHHAIDLPNDFVSKHSCNLLSVNARHLFEYNG